MAQGPLKKTTAESLPIRFPVSVKPDGKKDSVVTRTSTSLGPGKKRGG